MSNEELIPVFIPSLSAILLHREQEKGSPLTEAEVIGIRDEATVVMLPKAQADKMDESRGYADINPELCWLQWRLLRLTLHEKPEA